MADEGYSFEQARIRLDEIVSQVRKKDTSLERSLDLLEEGVRLANSCTELIDHTEWRSVAAEGESAAEGAEVGAEGESAEVGEAAEGDGGEAETAADAEESPGVYDYEAEESAEQDDDPAEAPSAEEAAG